MPMIHLGDHSDVAHAAPPSGAMKGLDPRNYATHPKGFYAAIPMAKIQPMSDEDIIAAIKRKDADRSWLTDLRNIGNNGKRIPSRDQDGEPYCWMHSGVSCAILCRARDHSPYADLSAFGPACMIKNYRSEGGWSAEGVAFLADRGCPTSKTWAQQSKKKANDNPATWEEAALYRVTLKFADIPENDTRLAATYIIHNVPCTLDINAWRHAVAGVRVKSWSSSRSGQKFEIWNSWGDSWSEDGIGEISGSYLPNDMVAVDSVMLSV